MSPRILYIEDDPLNRRLIQVILTHLNYRYIGASTGQDGLQIAQVERPELILTDINLPDMDGFTVQRSMKSNLLTSHIPIVALTANVMHGDRKDIMAAGFDGYLAKPVNKIVVRNVIENLLRNSLHTTIA